MDRSKIEHLINLRRGPLLCFLAAASAACGLFAWPATATAQNMSAGVLQEVPAFLTGEFIDDYGNAFNITATAWVMHSSSRYDVDHWAIADRYVIARNHIDNPTDALLWTRIDWVLLQDMEPWTWAYCLTEYAAESPAAAEAAPAADREHPTTGCGGFPFSRMRRR